MSHKIPFCFLILTLLSLTTFGQMPPPPQSGGWMDGWDNYDNSITPGLGPRVVNWDFTGVRDIDSIPPAYEHPRIYFDADGLPDLRNRLLNTVSGRAIMKQINAFCIVMQWGYNDGQLPDYNHNEDYAQDADGNRLIDNAGFWNSKGYYDKLVSQDPVVWDANATDKRKMLLSTVMAFEAFNCLIHQGQLDTITDTYYDDRAADLATAMAHWATLALADTTTPLDSTTYESIGGIHMALAYDLNYNAMTAAQQNIVRQALAAITPVYPLHGSFLDAPAVTSNWCGLNSFEIITNMAIEGETGYSPTLSERWFRAYHTFINYGFYESGAPWEGLGKNYMFATTAIAMARRGYSMLGHPHMRKFGNDYLTAIMQPFGYGFTSYDVWGGSGSDPVTGEYKFHSALIIMSLFRQLYFAKIMMMGIGKHRLTTP